MPDRSPSRPTLRTLSPATVPAAAAGHGPAVLLRERRPSPPSEQGGGSGAPEGRGETPAEDNPFAPPPEGTPDRPWQPRRPTGQDGGDHEGQGHGNGNQPWGQWSDRQPGRSQDGFGERPGRGGGPEGPGAQNRWDPTDPNQRRARYALLSGMWGFFFALFDWPFRSWFFGGVALLLASLAMFWAISALRARPAGPESNPPADPDRPAPPAPATTPGGRKQQRTAAVTGLVTSSLALTLLASAFAARVAYADFYTCTADALTLTAEQNCDRLLPEDLRPALGNQD
ncbi:hypothetical protein [Streptomyces physcomitrii]|uniref:hypothetical protein n=1 Tax=Streptomyces physcomitrii TaxID=2724184 RepID=UPI001444A2C6|nr:hypothetical protein [Streptomyces physcomitrii]